MARFSLLLVLFALWPCSAHAHPVPRSNHDRTITVRLHRDPGGVLLSVAYRLEVDELTVIFEDMRPFADEIDFGKFRRDNKVSDFYSEFVRIYAPILARNLDAALDGKPLKLECVKRQHTLKDEEGRALGHLRCDFEFRATVPAEASKEHRLTFREGNYELQNGVIDVSLVADGLRIVATEAPSAEVKKRAATERLPGDEERLRRVSATFALPPGAKVAHLPPPKNEHAVTQPPRPAPSVPDEEGEGLLELFLHSGHAPWVLLLLFAGIGAVHALTPGHGKTLVAAYLVGENGTTWHAILLGLVTTLTHTAIVIVVALALWLFYPAGMSEGDRRNIQTGLQLAMGLLVVCFGVWLLLRRLSGQADHFHLGGDGHHHHGHGHHHHPHHHDHTHADHHHDAQGRAVPKRAVGTWGLVLLGMSGGIVPCWDAIAILAVAVGTDMIWLALPLVLAFSAGLASVLVVIGVLVVHAKGFAGSHWGEGRVVRSLPTISAALVTLLGLWLCYDSVRPRPPKAPAAVQAAWRP